VHWALYDDAGRVLYAFEAAYTLASIDGALRISAIAHNEIPRYRECLSQIASRNRLRPRLMQVPPWSETRWSTPPKEDLEHGAPGLALSWTRT
jgi:hypothetical protein